jgi:hypothetical protein
MTQFYIRRKDLLRFQYPDCIVSISGTIDELERFGRKHSQPYRQVLSKCMPRKTKENHVKHWFAYPVFRQRFEPSASQYKNRGLNDLDTLRETRNKCGIVKWNFATLKADRSEVSHNFNIMSPLHVNLLIAFWSGLSAMLQ